MKIQLNNQPLDQTVDLGQCAPDHSASAASSPAIIPAAESSPASAQILRKLELKRLKALQRKQRADSFLNKLTDAQLAKVLAWFEDEPNIVLVYYHVTSPAPAGLGLQVSLPTLRRIRAHIAATHSNARTTEILDTISERDADPSQSTRIQSAINHLLNQKAFELARTEPGSPELFELLATVERLSALDLKRQKIALDREKMLRRAHQASTPPPPREHKVKLTIFPPAPENSEGHQPVNLIAPVTEVICN